MKRWACVAMCFAVLHLAAQPSAPRFEVATVKPNTSGEERVSGGYQPGGRYRVTNYTLRALIAAAYLRPQVNPDFLIAGGPKWIDTDRFDIDAKAAEEFPAGPENVNSPRRLMLQKLLEDRFGLKVHHETRQGSIYALQFAADDRKLGPKLKLSSADCTAPGAQGCFTRIGPGSVAAGGTRLAQLLSLLPRFVDRIVTDETGITGLVDLELSWTPAPGEWVAPGPEDPPSNGPSLFTAMREQLGLKLQSKTGPVDVLVVDDAHAPTQN